MENNSLSDKILKMSNNVPTLTSTSIPDSMPSTNNESIWESISSFYQNINVTTVVIIILVLTFLGFNVFYYISEGGEYLAKVTEIFAYYFQYIVNEVGIIFVYITERGINIAAHGTHTALDMTTNLLDKGLSKIEEVTDTTNEMNNISKTTLPSQAYEKINKTKEKVEHDGETSIHKRLNTLPDKQQHVNSGSGSGSGSGNFEPIESSSNIKASGKKGWCYVGKDREHRTCAPVGENDECMSGDIFPTNEICINPNLR
jgi:hypothetical protein